MLIESLIKRTGGTVIELEAPKAAYHFKPTETDDRHIADVDVSHHAKTLLRIKEGFRAVDDVDLDDDQGEGEDTGRNLVGSNVHNAEYTILGGDVISLDDLVGMAFEDSGLEEQAWNDLADQERYDFIDATLKELQYGEHGDDEQGSATHPDQAGGAEQQPETERTDDAAQDADAGDSDETTPVGESSTDGAAAADVNGNGITDSLEGLTRAQLEPIYVKKFGRKPSSAMKVEDIKRALSEDDD